MKRILISILLCILLLSAIGCTKSETIKHSLFDFSLKEIENIELFTTLPVGATFKQEIKSNEDIERVYMLFDEIKLEEKLVLPIMGSRGLTFRFNLNNDKQYVLTYTDNGKDGILKVNNKEFYINYDFVEGLKDIKVEAIQVNIDEMPLY